ncbi:MAG: hypothetical protein MHPSP_002461, partial [Paramarteilia canceri]
MFMQNSQLSSPNLIYVKKLGLRIVEPYTSTFKVSEQDLSKGLFKVNNENVTGNYILKPNDIIEHTSHYHEPPVFDREIKIIHDDEELLVVDKPCSMPVHPCGRFHYNSLISILKIEKGYPNLRNQNRIDRDVSGVIALAKTKNKARYLQNLNETGATTKLYLALVEGKFP